MGTTTAMAIVPPLVRPPLFVLLPSELTSPAVPDAVADEEVNDDALVPVCALCVEVMNSVTTCPFDAPSVGVTVTTDVITTSDDVGVSFAAVGVDEVGGVVCCDVAGVVGEVVVGVVAGVDGAASVVVWEVVGGNMVVWEVVEGGGSVVVTVDEGLVLAIALVDESATGDETTELDVAGETAAGEVVAGALVAVLVELEDMVNRLSRITLGFLRPRIPYCKQCRCATTMTETFEFRVVRERPTNWVFSGLTG
jgi:hypothetical protein